jgi:hypothetical protein
MVEIICTHVCKWKNETYFKLFQEWEGGQIREKNRKDAFNYDIW